MKKKRKQVKGAVIYQAKNRSIELRGDAEHETIWATQAEVGTVPHPGRISTNDIYRVWTTLTVLEISSSIYKVKSHL